MTERLYYTDAYCTRFDARVVDKKDERTIYLDRTAFYPTSGGQLHDRGSLGQASVVDVIDEGERIAHVVEGTIDAELVTGEIDWHRRYDHMQQHTGQHVLSAIFAESLGARTVSVHFGAQASTLDLDVQMLSAPQLVAVEQRANEIAWEKRPVQVVFEDAASVQGLRKPSERAGELRVVSIEGLDRSACGGTHVRNTSEIGPVLLRRSEKAKKALRVEFLCGSRALKRARADFTLLTRMAQSASTSLDELGTVFESQTAALRESESARRKVGEVLDQYRARELYAAAQVDALGVRRAFERARGPLEDVRGVALAYATLPRALYVATTESPPAVLVAASEDAGVHAGEALRAAVTSLGGRGGGSPRLAQGTLPSVDALAAALRLLSPDASSRED